MVKIKADPFQVFDYQSSEECKAIKWNLNYEPEWKSSRGSSVLAQLVIRLFAPLLVFTLSSLFSSNANELTNWPL